MTNPEAALPIIPGRGFSTTTSLNLRLDYLRKLGLKTDSIAQSQLQLEDIRHNIESFIGSVEIPLGVVGPLLYKYNLSIEEVYCAAGTLEGALVYSMNRGARVLSKSGGFKAHIKHQRMLRAPTFILHSADEALELEKYVAENFPTLKQVAEAYSNHAKLIEIQPVRQGNVLHLRFYYTTGDASGQNMTTTCTWHAMLRLVKDFRQIYPGSIIDFIIEGNGATDKKISSHNITHGRGIHVTAACHIPEDVIYEVLRTSSDKIIRFFEPSKLLAKQDGMIGYNINAANVVAAIFAATGQDLASIHESSVGFLSLEKTAKGLNIELTLPNLVVGTVGGGTHLPKQSEALRLMGCLGKGKVERFASLIAGFALGLEISTYAAIVSGEFAKSHEKLGRNKPVNWLVKAEIQPEFIVSFLDNDCFEEKPTSLLWAENDYLDNGILTNITAQASSKFIGNYRIQINSSSHKHDLILKSKALGEEVIKGLHMLAASIDTRLADLIAIYRQHLEYSRIHENELNINRFLKEHQYAHIPELLGIYRNEEREIYLLLQQHIAAPDIKLHNSENHPERWSVQDIRNCILAIHQFHQLGSEALKNSSAPSSVQAFEPWHAEELYARLLTLLHEISPLTDNTQLCETLNSLSPAGMEAEFTALELPRTLVHMDFNPRNIMIMNNGQPCIYDWELCCLDLPHRDIVELLSFVLPDSFQKEDLMAHLAYHYQLNKTFAWPKWIKGYVYALRVYILTRVSFYAVSGILSRYEFSERVLRNALLMYKMLKE